MQISEKIKSYKNSEIDLNGDFKSRTSIIIKVFVIYFLLTLTNLLIIWLAIGSNQMRLISEKSVLLAHKTSNDLVMRLKPILDKSTWLDFLLNQKDQEDATKEESSQEKNVLNALKVFKESKNLIIPNFSILSADGIILYIFGDTTSQINDVVSKEIFQKVLNTLQLYELKKKTSYSSPNLLNYNMEIFIPFITDAGRETIFYTQIPMESIKKELYTLIRLAVIILILTLFIQVLFGIVIYRMIILPVRILERGAEKVARGGLSFQLPVQRKRDELGRLMFSFNNMVASLREKTDKLNSTIEVLENYNEVMENELALAQEIQQGIMPKKIIGTNIRGDVYHSPLEKVSGDYYDIFHLSDGSTGVLLIDASGHGVPAALVTIIAKVHFSSLITDFTDPASLLTEVNTEICRVITTGDFLTAIYLIIKPDLELLYCSASHPPVPVLKKKTGKIELLETTGMIVGAFEKLPIPYETKKMKLNPGDRIVLYTDGLTEGCNSDNIEYGKERLYRNIKYYANLPINEFNKKVIEDVDQHAEGEPRRDDCTLLTVEIP
jgi:sigma-B regulation protein RsbU (phosphoserine phosphatase)